LSTTAVGEYSYNYDFDYETAAMFGVCDVAETVATRKVPKTDF